MTFMLKDVKSCDEGHNVSSTQLLFCMFKQRENGVCLWNCIYFVVGTEAIEAIADKGIQEVTQQINRCGHYYIYSDVAVVLEYIG